MLMPMRMLTNRRTYTQCVAVFKYSCIYLDATKQELPVHLKLSSLIIWM